MNPQRESPITRDVSLRKILAAHFPPGQFGRYIGVGLVNTLFGYALFAGLTALLTPHLPYAYLWASLIGSLLAITFSFLNYKWFIFKTRGNYLREWSRCVIVYGGNALLSTALLAPTVFAIRRLTVADKMAPYIGGALLTGLAVVTSFLGHRNFSFAPRKNEA